VCLGVATPSGTVFPYSAVLPLCGLRLRNGVILYAGVGSSSIIIFSSGVHFEPSCHKSDVLRAGTGVRAVTLRMDPQWPRNVPRSDHAFGDRVTTELVRVTSSLYEMIVFWCLWISPMEFTELFQSSFQEVVKGFLRPILPFWVVQPFDEVEYPFVIFPTAFDRRHNFFHIVFLALLDVVRFPEYLRWVRWHSMCTLR